MSNYTDMPLNTALQVGDIVTITGPGEHDVTVREVMGVHERTGPFVSDMASTTIRFAHLISGLTRTLTRVQRPVPVLPALPTVPGTYILTFDNLEQVVWTLADGVWHRRSARTDGERALADYIAAGATLTRVIPADQATHPEVDIQNAWDYYTSEESGDLFVDFESTIRRLIAGGFDK